MNGEMLAVIFSSWWAMLAMGSGAAAAVSIFIFRALSP